MWKEAALRRPISLMGESPGDRHHHHVKCDDHLHEEHDDFDDDGD